MNNSVIIHDLGLLEYEEALSFQLELFNEIVNTKIITEEIVQQYQLKII